MEKKRPKKGDIVRLCRDGYSVPNGAVGTIVFDDHSALPFRVDFGLTHIWLSECAFELVESDKSTRKLKVGDTVRIKSRTWYEQHPENRNGCFCVDDIFFTPEMAEWCGTEHNIAYEIKPGYYRLEGCGHYTFTPEMFDLEEKPSLTVRIKDFFTPNTKPLINGNIPLIKRNKLLTDIKLD